MNDAFRMAVVLPALVTFVLVSISLGALAQTAGQKAPTGPAAKAKACTCASRPKQGYACEGCSDRQGVCSCSYSLMTK
jgi:hypothetical protein